MEEQPLYMYMLGEMIKYGKVQVTFPDLELPPQELLNSAAYRILEEIVDIVRDDSLSDPECFDLIERIVCSLEKWGISGGNRHDFG